jgi:multidrug resistance efflux pump
MKTLLILLLTPLLLFSKDHYAKLEPIENLTIKSAVSAEVIHIKRALEGKLVKNSTIIELDSKLDKTRIDSIHRSLDIIERMIQTNETILSLFEESKQRQEEYYYRLSNMQSVSQTKKDNAFYTYTNSRTQYFSTQEKIDSLHKQRVDLNYEIARLQESIAKKSIQVHHKFIDKLLVNKGDYVNMGTPLLQLKDLSSAKLVLFLEADEIEMVKNKTIYIDEKKTPYKISKIWKVSDDKFISSYRTEIIIKNPKQSFSKLLKVEFK